MIIQITFVVNICNNSRIDNLFIFAMGKSENTTSKISLRVVGRRKKAVTEHEDNHFRPGNAGNLGA